MTRRHLANQDRNRGQGLPSGLDPEAFERLRAATQRRRGQRLAPQPEPAPVPTPAPSKRFASVAEVEKAGFVRVAAGFYREAEAKVAHPIWELRRAGEEQEGYLLVRKKEDRLVDLRRAGMEAAVASGITQRIAKKAQVGRPPLTDGPIPLDGGSEFDATIEEGMARALFVNAWAEWQEEEGDTSGWAGQDLMNLAPETSQESKTAAAQLAQQFVSMNDTTLTGLLQRAAQADGMVWPTDHETARSFGHDLAMQALGHGVSWFDNHAEFPIQFPRIDHSYFNENFTHEARMAQAEGGEPPTALQRGDQVVVEGMPGYTEVWLIGQYDEHLGDRRIQVMDPSTRHKLWMNEKNIQKKAAMHVKRDLSICSDCVMYVANGEVPHEGRDNFAEEVAQHCAAKGIVEMNVSVDDDTEGGQYGFKWHSPCDLCGSSLGGDRYHAVELAEGADPNEGPQGRAEQARKRAWRRTAETQHPQNHNILMIGNQVAKYSSVGSYPIFYLTQDGSVLSAASVQENLEQCCDPTEPQWYVVAHDVNWEDPALYDDNNNERIESAYAEDQAESGGPKEGAPMTPSAGVVLAPGVKVLAVKQGQVADAIVMMLHPEQEAVELMFGGDAAPSMVPIEMVVTEMAPEPMGPPDAGMGDVVVGEDDLADPFDVPVSPPSELAPAQAEAEFERAAFAMLKEAADWASEFRPGVKVTTTQAFRPFYHGQKLNIPAGAVFEVEGMHRPDADTYYGFPFLGRPAPKSEDGFRNLRVRLTHEGGGTLLITPDEFKQYFEAEPELESEHPEMPDVPEVRTLRDTSYARPPKPAPATPGPHPNVTGQEPTRVVEPTAIR